MIQSILFFVLGFLCAGFLALLVMPAFWRRALTLTRKRIEAATPLSLAEFQAEKDRMRAEFAMTARRLEMSAKSYRDKATGQLIEIERDRQEKKRLAAEISDRDAALARVADVSGGLSSDLLRREEEMTKLSDQLAEADRLLETRAAEIEKLGRMYDEAALVSSNRQIELITRQNEVDKLTGDLTAIRGRLKEDERLLSDAGVDKRLAREALASERKKTGDLESRVGQLMSTLADREEKLERRERELSRLRERMKATKASLAAAQAPAAEQASDAAKEVPMSMASTEDEQTVAKLREDRDRLEARLTALTRENRKLRGDLIARENAALREEIGDLAAQMVTMTASSEGAGSPIAKALAEPAPAGSDPHQKITSLADRVKRLQTTTRVR